MSNLIDRQAAIDDLHGKDPSQIWDTADIEVWVNGLPSAQPEPCEDVISRQAAISAVGYCQTYLFDSRDKDKKISLEDAEYAIEQLPSAQHDPCDDPRADIYYLAEKIGIHRLYALVVELRGEPEPCEDAVSRAEAKRILFDFAGCIVDTPNGIYQQAYKKYNDMMDNLPSVNPKPKTGKWIQHDARFPWSHHYECSECGNSIDMSGLNAGRGDANYCPNCGAKMEG